MIDVSFTVPRISNDERTIAHVTARVSSSELAQEKGFLAALRRAISVWILTTEEGQDTWEYTACDFNIGDLASYLDEQGLVALLEREGIHGLDIPTVGADTKNWTFDTVLGPENKYVGQMLPLPEFGLFIGTSEDRAVLYSAPMLADGSINPDEVAEVLAATPEFLAAANALLNTEFAPEDFPG